MTEIRRLRTQAERDADGTAWRAVAGTRPGYATYPGTAPGNPSWWQRPVLRLEDPAETERWERDKRTAGPTPVDGETCTKWCGFCHLGNGPAVVDAAVAVGRVLAEHMPAIGEALPDPDIWMTTEPVAPPRRRWWHRYTRRNP